MAEPVMRQRLYDDEQLVWIDGHPEHAFYQRVTDGKLMAQRPATRDDWERISIPRDVLQRATRTRRA